MPGARSAPNGGARTRATSPAVVRAGAILDVLAESGGQPLGVSELSRRLQIAKSSVATVCNALADAELLDRGEGGYRLGRKLVELGAAYLAGVDIAQEFHQASRRLGTGFEETLQLAALNEALEVVYLARRDGTAPVRLTSDIGRQLPASSTATGKALLAGLPEDELDSRLRVVDALPRVTPRSITDPDALRTELAKVRDRGYAIDDEETVEGVLCVGMAIPGEQLTTRYALSFTLLKARASLDRVESLVGRLRELTGLLRRSGTM